MEVFDMYTQEYISHLLIEKYEWENVLVFSRKNENDIAVIKPFNLVCEIVKESNYDEYFTLDGTDYYLERIGYISPDELEWLIEEAFKAEAE